MKLAIRMPPGFSSRVKFKQPPAEFRPCGVKTETAQIRSKLPASSPAGRT